MIHKRRFRIGLILTISLSFFLFGRLVEAQTWPAPGDWILLSTTDKGEDGTEDDFRDVQNVYYYVDSSHLYLRMCCRDIPAFTKTSPPQEARYKWFLDFDNNSYVSGGQAVEAEYVLFAEDTDDILPGEVYLLNDTDNDGYFDEWEGDYSGGLVTDPAVAGYRIEGSCFDLYVAWANIGSPASVWFIWTTDQENPNLEQSPNTDSPDEGVVLPIGPVTPPTCTDNDSDGYGVCPDCGTVNGCTYDGDDCNDGNASVNPGATEVCNDGIDNDCDGNSDCDDSDCVGDPACLPSAVATPKTIQIAIPGSKCFTINIDNPGPYDITVSQSIHWTQDAPTNVQTISLNGTRTVLAGQSKTLNWPCVDVGSGATPGEYPLDIIWTGSNSNADPIEFNTDPSILLYSSGGSGGGGSSSACVGGIASPVNKLDLLAPWIMLTALILLTIGIIASKRFRKKFEK